MSGRLVRLATMAAVAAIGGTLAVTSASAGCCSCGAPVVYSYTYASPCASSLPPMFVVNQGPAYTLPVPILAEPTPAYPASSYVEESYDYGAAPYRSRYYGSPYAAQPYGYRYNAPYAYQGYRYDYRRGPVANPYAPRFYGDRGYRATPRYTNVPNARYGNPRYAPTPARYVAPKPVPPAPGYVNPMR